MQSADAILSMFDMPSKVRPIEAGTRFGMLRVVGPAAPLTRANGRKASTSLCHCDCGSERAYRNNGLRQGYWKSCGCKQKEHAAEGRVTHGHARGGRRTRELSTYKSMVNRCTDPRCAAFPDYGARGISVCDRWLNSFEAFIADMGLKPSPSHSIERRNVDGNYAPDNCHWAEAIEQANNKRNTFWVTFRGRRMSLAEFGRETGIRSHTLRLRLLSGMTADEAAKAKVRRCNRKKEVHV